MKRIPSKIKAFTLTEVMVVIVISTIVAGLAFSILRIVQSNMYSIEHNYAYKSELISLETEMTIDFNTFPSATWEPKENTMTVFSPLQERKYQIFKDSIVTDINAHRLKIKDKIFYFEGEVVSAGAIDAVKFTFYDTREPYRLFVFKYNDPSIHFKSWE